MALKNFIFMGLWVGRTLADYNFIFVDGNRYVAAFADFEVANHLPSANPGDIRVIAGWDFNFHDRLHWMFNNRISLIGHDLQ